jgi:hypothetical protein
MPSASSLNLEISLNLRTSEEKHFFLTSQKKGSNEDSDLSPLSPSLGQPTQGSSPATRGVSLDLQNA